MLFCSLGFLFFFTTRARNRQGQGRHFIQGFSEHGVELAVNLQLVSASGAEEKQVRDEINCAVLLLAQAMEIGLANSRKPPRSGASPAAPVSVRAA